MPRKNKVVKPVKPSIATQRKADAIVITRKYYYFPPSKAPRSRNTHQKKILENENKIEESNISDLFREFNK